MDCFIDRTPLLQAVSKIQSIVEKKGTIQILGNILFTAKGQELSLCATDLEVGVKIVLTAEILKEGRVTLSAKHCLDILKELPDKKLHLRKKENNWTELNCGKSSFNIVSISADQYPSLPYFEDRSYIEARADVLREMIDHTQFVTSSDTNQYHINGVFFEVLENALVRITATDSHRLSFVDHEVFSQQPELKKGVIIPKKGLTELRKFLDDADSTIELSFERGYLFVRLERASLFIRLIEGEYPDYRHVIPKEVEEATLIHRTSFHAALKRVSLLASEKSRAIRFLFQNNTLLISASNPDMGDAQEEIEIQYSKEPLDIAFNSKYLLDALIVMDSELLEFHLKDRLSPSILREQGKKNQTYVIMPMRI